MRMRLPLGLLKSLSLGMLLCSVGLLLLSLGMLLSLRMLPLGRLRGLRVLWLRRCEAKVWEALVPH